MPKRKNDDPALYAAARADAAQSLRRAGWVEAGVKFGVRCWRAPDGSVLTEDTALARLRDEPELEPE